MNLSQNEIKTKIAAVLKVPVSHIGDTVALKGIVPDSFVLVELLIELQEEYGIRLEQADIESISTVADLTDLISLRAQTQAQALA